MANNEIVGKITCPFCETDTDVKKNVKQKYYYNCKRCGIANLHGKGFQEFIQREAVMYGKPEAENEKMGGEPEPQQQTQEPQKQKSWIEGFWSDEEEQQA